MSFFDKAKEKVKKTFEKKPCSICGTEAGVFSRDNLKDGVLCSSCRSRLSPFVGIYSGTTVEGVQAHLAYRKACSEEFSKMKITKVFGDEARIHVDEYQGKFAVFNGRAVPDILDFSQVQSCTLEIKHDPQSSIDVYEEKTTDAEGKRISYDPKRYCFTYTFGVKMEVDHPQFKRLEFNLYTKKMYVHVTEYPGFSIGTFNPRVDNGYYQLEKKYNEFVTYMNIARGQALKRLGASIAGNGTAPVIVISPEMLNTMPPQPALPTAAPQSAAPAYCPECGSRVNGGRFCSHCGARL